ncbi:MAG TPA: hypothetical protein VI136_07935, partial [Verrucomicrobiae bacterium]
MSFTDSLLLEEPLKALPDGHPVREVWIAFRTDDVHGSGTENDPYDGSTAERFDARMLATPANTTIRIGPGVFETRGYNGISGWQPKSGQKIFGSGINVTVLKLVSASSSGLGYHVIGGDSFLTSFEASDFTVDCNLAGQAIQGHDFAPVASGAVGVRGRHIRLRRIRAINFGTQTAAAECFVFYGAYALPPETEPSDDCVIEECILEQPSLNNVRETTCLIAIGSERAEDGVMAYHRGCAIRNCVVDCEYRDRPAAVASITPSGTTATVVTRKLHCRSQGDWVIISGAQVNGSLLNNFNGSYQITQVDSTTQFRYTMQPWATQTMPTSSPTGEIWVGKWPSELVGISTISKTDTGPWIVTVTTATPHFRAPGNNVVMRTGFAYEGKYQGSFKILSWCDQNRTVVCDQNRNNAVGPLPMVRTCVVSWVASAEDRALRGRNL